MDGELQHEHDIIVHSDLILPPAPELGGGERTRRITTVRGARARRRTRETDQVDRAGDRRRVSHGWLTPTTAARTRTTSSATPRQSAAAAPCFPVDVRVSTTDDVSREHVRIRRDPETGAFFLIDLSIHGTTLDGRPVPRGVDEGDGGKRENGAETPLAPRARIGLAETVFLDFEQVTMTLLLWARYLVLARALAAAVACSCGWPGETAHDVARARRERLRAAGRHRRRAPAPRERGSVHCRRRAASSSSSTASAARRRATRPPTRRSPMLTRALSSGRPAPCAGRHPRSDHDRQQRDPPARRHTAGVARHGLRAHGGRRRRRSRRRRPRRRHAALQLRGGRSRRSRPTTRRSASARTPARSPSPRRCGIRGATRCTATSGPNRTKHADPDFVYVAEIDCASGRRAAALQRRPDGSRAVRDDPADRPHPRRLARTRSPRRSWPRPTTPAARTTSPWSTSKASGVGRPGARAFRAGRQRGAWLALPRYCVVAAFAAGTSPSGGRSALAGDGVVLGPSLPAWSSSAPASRSRRRSRSAAPGSTVVVEPGEYRERLTLKDDVRVVSRVPRGATLRLPGTAAESDAAVVAVGIVERRARPVPHRRRRGHAARHRRHHAQRRRAPYGSGDHRRDRRGARPRRWATTCS